MRDRTPKDYPVMVRRKFYAWSAWMLLLIVLGWLLFAWIGSGIVKFFGMIFS